MSVISTDASLRVPLKTLVFAIALISQPLLAQEPSQEQETAQGDVPAGEQAMTELAALESREEGTTALPSLPGLFERALRHDADLDRQRLELEAVEQEMPLARSELLPQVTASGSYLYQDSTNIQTERTPEDSGLDQVTERPAEITENFWQVQLQQPLFSLERWRGLDSASSRIGAAEIDLALVERDLALLVSEAYVNAYLGSSTLGLLETQQEALELQVRQAQRAYDIGVGNRIDLLEARSRLDQAIADAVQARNELDDALTELERLTGLLPEFGRPTPGDLSAVALERNWDNENAWLEGVERNLDIQRALAEREIRDSETSVRRSGYFPELNLNVSYSDRNSEDELRETEDLRASVELSVPLYRGGRTVAGVRQGVLRAEASQRSVDNQRNLAAQEVRKRLRSLNGNVQRLDALEQAIESSELFLEAAERGEQLGLRDLVDVLDAQASLYDQHIQFVDTLGRYVLDRLALQSAVGDLGSDDLQEAMVLLSSISRTSR